MGATRSYGISRVLGETLGLTREKVKRRLDKTTQ